MSWKPYFASTDIVTSNEIVYFVTVALQK